MRNGHVWSYDAIDANGLSNGLSNFFVAFIIYCIYTAVSAHYFALLLENTLSIIGSLVFVILLAISTRETQQIWRSRHFSTKQQWKV